MGGTVLKHCLVDYYEKAYMVAKKMKIPDARLSKIVNGILEPTQEEKKKLCKILGKNENELFPEEDDKDD